MYLLGIDLGSSSVKVALVNGEKNETVRLAHFPKTEMTINSPQIGWAEQDPKVWWTNLIAALSEILQSSEIPKSKIGAIGISYQMHGLVLVDKNHDILRPAIIWCDSRATQIGENAAKKLGKEYCLKHYLNSPGNFTASKLKWVKDNEPDIFSRIHKVMLPGDYLAMKMSGQILTTVSGLSEAILWDFKNEKLAYSLLDHYGISEGLIPNVVNTFANQGKLTVGAANELGLDPGIPISYRAGDQPNNAMSLGVIHPNEIAATGGTSGVVYGVVNKVKSDFQSRVNGFAHVNHSAKDPRIGILLCINGAGSQYAWIKKQIAEKEISFAEMEEAQKEISIGSDGLCILPFGNGAERMLQNNYKGAQIHNLQFNTHTKAHFYRAALEGIAFGFIYGLKILKNIGIETNRLRVGNDNLFQSAVFSDTIATIANVQIDVIETTGAVGAAKGAGFGIDYYPSLKEAIGQQKIIKSFFPKDDIKEKYLEAYRNWKTILEKEYKSI